ncbi:MAG: apolipoprotein N-acyltransferase, partial [Sphingopyxis sp.]
VARDSARPEGEGLSASFILLFAAAWIVTEWLRSWLFTGFAWNPLAAIWITDQFSDAWVAQLSQWLGTYGLSGFTIIAASMVGAWVSGMKLQWARDRLRPEPTEREQLWAQLGFGAALAVGFIVVLLLPHDSEPPTTDSGTPVTIVQPNINQGDKWDLTQRLDNFRRLAGLSRSHDPATPRLLLWPEAAVPDYLEDGTPADWTIEDPAAVRARLAALLGRDDLLLTGAVRLETNAARSDVQGARNAVFTLDARGRLGPRYDKAHLVPYGEYLPMRGLLEPLGLSRLVPGAVDFWPGPGPRSIELGRFGKVGIQICYEIIFSGQVVDRANRPSFIFNPSNDAWFGSWGPPQHLAQARLRAIEEGLPVVRATPTGISAIIEPDGRILEALPMHAAGRIDATLPPPHAPTVFAQLGNALPLAFAVFLGALGVAFGRTRRYGAAT